MIFTLGVNAVMRGLMVAHTGGFAPQTAATDLMQYLAVGKILGIPVALIVWAAVSIGVMLLLQRTAVGKSIYAIGNKEAAAYLAGVPTKWVIVCAFCLCGMLAGLSGTLLAGYSTKAYQGMGDAYLLPAIAAVVIGGTHILGGRGRYLGTLVGVILIGIILRVIDNLKLFDLVYITTRGGPGDSTELLTYFTYRQDFAFFNVGYGSAAAVVILIISIFVTTIAVSFLRKMQNG